ncbi:MAG: methyltransferase domain-containing protein [Litoreibacter sp.]
MTAHGQNFDLKEEIRAYWSARAATFDESASHKIEDTFGLPVWQAFLRQALDLPPSGDMEGLEALDLASGTGEISRALCSLNATVTGVDFSESMHVLAKVKLAGEHWTPILSDAENLGTLPDDSFDFAITRHLVWTLTSPLEAFAEWYRVLRPGGRLVINDGDWMTAFSTSYRIKRWIAQLLAKERPRAPDLLSQDASIRSRLPYSEGLSASRLREDVTSQGFEFLDMLDIAPLYQSGMRGHPLATRLRQSAENRFALVFEKPRSA